MLDRKTDVRAVERPWHAVAADAVRTHPVTTIAIAFGVGFATAMLSRPRNPVVRVAVDSIFATALAVVADAAKETLGLRARAWFGAPRAAN